MPSLEPLMTVKAKLNFNMIGDVGAGTRLDVPFEGTATSSHWEGERPVRGVDYVTVRANGIAELDIRAIVGEGEDAVSYDAKGRQTADGIQEVFTFSTASESLSFLNGITAVGFGSVDKADLTLDIHQIVA